MIFRTLLLALITLPLLCSRADALPSNLRVQLFEMRDHIADAKIKGPLQIVSPRNQILGDQWIAVEVKNNLLQLRNLSNRASRPVLTARSFVVQPRDNRGIRIRVNENLDRTYIGRLVFSVDDSKPGVTGLKITNVIPTSHYVASVVGSESPPHCPPEALKALAVLVIGIVERKKDGEFVGDSTKEQAYKGCEFARPDVERAVKSVLNKRLFYKNSPIQPYFHSTCAGGTSCGADIFGEGAKPLLYLQSVKCVYCTKSPFWKTKTKVVPASTIKNVFDGGMPIITKFDDQKRPTEIVITPAAPGASEQHLSGYEAMIQIGRARGWGLIPGTRFNFQSIKANNVDSIQIQSSGAGHGVGLCQWGAAGLAQRGKSYDQILNFYFPGSKIVSSN